MKLDTLIEKISKSERNLANFGHTIRIDLPEGSIFMDRCGTISQDYRTADCSLRSTTQVINGIIDGHLDPHSAYITKKMDIAGDINIALRLKNHFQ